MTSDLPIGSELLGYRIERVLGRGGMGVVYLAEDLRLKRRVALKLLSPELASDERFRERFLVESQLAAGLDHPNIVPVYEAGEAGERLYISMRHVEGSDLKTLLRGGPLPPARTLAVVSQLAAALDAAHASGLVHRDVKPSNVLIAPGAGQDGADHVYLADFGLTIRVANAGARESGGSQSLGTADYVAPEQIRGGEVDGRADVYSLGCLLYECLAGEPPYRRSSDAAVLFAHLQEPPPSHPGLDQVLATALAKSPDDRYQTCRDLVLAARRALGLGDVRGRRRLQAGALAGVVLVAAAVLATVLLTGGGNSASATTTGRLVEIDPKTNGVVRTGRMGQDPSGLAVAGGRVWLATLTDSTVWSVDAKTFVSARIAVNGPLGVAARRGIVYVGGADGLTRIVASAAQSTDELKLGGVPVIASGPAGVWFVANDAAYTLSDASLVPPFGTARVARFAQIPLGSPVDENHIREDPAGIAVGERAVWVLGDVIDRWLYKIDPATGRLLASIPLPFGGSGVATGAGAVWVTAQLADKVLRIDPRTDRVVATIAVGRDPWGVTVGTGSIWVANTVDDTISRIDPRSDRVIATIPVGASPEQLAVGQGSVWVAALAD